MPIKNSSGWIVQMSLQFRKDYRAKCVHLEVKDTSMYFILELNDIVKGKDESRIISMNSEKSSGSGESQQKTLGITSIEGEPGKKYTECLG